MPTNNEVEPIGANRFSLEWNMDTLAFLREVSGLETTTKVMELQQSTKDGKVVTIKTVGPVPLAPGQVTVKYNALKDDPILKWRQQVVDGKMNEARRNVSVVVFGVDGSEQIRFNLKNAWPSTYRWSALAAGKNEVFEITVIIDHEELSVAK